MAKNPFDYHHSVTGKLFVNREEEARRLRSYCTSNANVLLLAPRRLGKSSLIRETFRRLPRRTHMCLYVDILKALDEGEVAQRILNELGRVAFGPARRGWLWLVDQLQRFRPAYTVDPKTGMPSITFQTVEAGLPSLERTLTLLETTARRRGRRIVLALDEFQVLMEFPDGGRVIAAMRTVIQHQRNISYIFAGSKAHVLLGLVNRRDQPFWGQLDVLELQGIPIHHFAPLAKSLFRRSHRSLPHDVLERIGAVCFDNPKRIQELLHGIYERPGVPTMEAVEEVLGMQIAAQRHRLEDVLSEVRPGHQKRLLMGLAREGFGTRLFSKSFIQKYRLDTSAHVQRAARALEDRGVLDRRNRFVDPYLYHYLRAEA